MIAGIVVAIIAIIVILVLLVYFLVIKKKDAEISSSNSVFKADKIYLGNIYTTSMMDGEMFAGIIISDNMGHDLPESVEYEYEENNLLI